MQQNSSGSSEQFDIKPETSPDVRAEVALLQESLNQTRTEMSHFRRRVERRQSEVDAHIQRTNILWAAMLLLIIALGTAIAVGLRSGVLVVRLPGTPAVAETAQAHLPSPVSSLEVKPNTPNYSPEDQQGQFQSEPPTPESARPPVVTPTEKIPDVSSQRKSTVPSDATQINDQRMNHSGSTSGLLSDAVIRSRIDFEVSRNKTQEVAPGIFLTVRDIDVEHQQINGWLQLSAEGRTVMLRGQGAQKAMIFATRNDVRRHELIFTRVGKQGVSGYLLIPTAG